MNYGNWQVVAPLRAGGATHGIPMSPSGGRIVTPLRGGGFQTTDMVEEQPEAASAEEGNFFSRMRAAFSKKPGA